MFVSACYNCAAAKPPQAYSKAPLQRMLFHAFNDNLVIDHICPELLGMTPRKNRYSRTSL
jgi:hypothetical protein